MTHRAQFTLQITLRDNYGFEQPLSMAIDLDQELRIAPRAVDEMKFGVGTFDGTIQIMLIRLPHINARSH